MRSLLPSLQDEILNHLDTERLTMSLKIKQGNKLDVWGELKIVSFARVVVAVYSVCLLSVFLRLQLNILGGYLFLQTSVTI